MTHHPLIPLPFNPLPCIYSYVSPFHSPFPPPSVLNHPLITLSLARYNLLLYVFPLPLSHHPPYSIPLITPSSTRYHLHLCLLLPLSPTFRTQSPSHHPIFNPLPSTPMSPPFPFIPPRTLAPHAIHASTLHAPPSPNGSHFSMVITISHMNYPETHLPRFTPAFPIISFPLLPTPPLECISIIPS